MKWKLLHLVKVQILQHVKARMLHLGEVQEGKKFQQGVRAGSSVLEVRAGRVDSPRDRETRMVFQYGEESPSVGWRGRSGSFRSRQGSSGGIQMQEGAGIYWGSITSRKHLCQLDEAAIQNIDFGQLLATIDLLKSAALIHKHDADGLIFWIDDPVFPDAGLLI